MQVTEVFAFARRILRKFLSVIYNTLPVAAQGAADPNGLRPHAAGPKVSEEIGVNRDKSKDAAGNSGLLGRSWEWWWVVVGSCLFLIVVGGRR